MSSVISTKSDFLSSDSIVKSLYQRNAKLKQQIEKVEQTLSNQSTISKGILPRQGLVSVASQEVMEKELENAYKLIKVYQTQIKNADKNSIGTVFERIQSLEKTNLEKTQQIKQLKKRLYNISKSIDGNSRKLTMPSVDDSESRLAKLHQQSSSLKQYVQQAISKYNTSQSNSNKQFQKIKQLQKSLISLGVAQSQLQALKSKKRQTTKPTEQVIQDRTIDHFKELKNQLKVLTKQHITYEKQLELLNKDYSQNIAKTQKAQKDIQQMDQRIEILQEEIVRMRKKK